MSTTIQEKRVAASAGMTFTLNSLGTSTTVGRQSTVIDSTTNEPVDANWTVILKTSASAIGSSKTISIYIFGSEDGTNYDQDDAVMGASDAAYTINSPSNLRLVKVISAPTSSKIYNWTDSVAKYFGGIMPRKWGLVVINDTNQSLASSGNSASYTEIEYLNS